eukprot:1153316-Pelagomonas_calceolata.AAC.9
MQVSGRRIDDSSLDAILQHVAPPSTKPSGPQQQQAASPSEQSLHGRLSSNLSQRPSGERQHNWQARRRMQSSVLQVSEQGLHDRPGSSQQPPRERQHDWQARRRMQSYHMTHMCCRVTTHTWVQGLGHDKVDGWIVKVRKLTTMHVSRIGQAQHA